MKRVVFLALLLAPALLPATFEARGVDAKPWRALLGSVGIAEAKQAGGQILVTAGDSSIDAATLVNDHILILQGTGKAAAALGIAASTERLQIRHIVDRHATSMPIIWEKPVSTTRTAVPADFEVFAKEKWTGAPVLAGKRTAHGAILWLATDPGAEGYERYPYVPMALVDLGWVPAAESVDLWAFFDSSYRVRADPEYLARWWRRAGISVLHAAAWHNMEPDPARDEFLRRAIEACHRNGISVYAWLELPHVSEEFWAAHPEWREKTAAGQDAQLDWRKLMNLENPACREAVAQLVRGLLARFDWDGVNLAELYFESLEGASNPARFTPMNEDVRREFQRATGFDPKQLFEAGSPYSAATHPEALRKFLNYRAGLATRMQQQWLDVVSQSRATKPYLDFVLTHIDDRFDRGIRDELGADVARTLPLMAAHRSTLLVEDPAPLWALGPERYARLAEKYHELTPERDHLAVDINVVERYQDVYPTKKQTGAELFELVHQAAVSFGQVALYFENSLERQDVDLLPAAAARAKVSECAPDEIEVQTPVMTRIAWSGPAALDGRLWPVQNDGFVLVPAGTHKLSTGFGTPPLTIRDFNGEIRSALVTKDRVELSYQSRTRAIALLGEKPRAIEVDGVAYPNGDTQVLLPAGQHLVSFTR